jgi:hypothetical protein
MRGLDVRVRAVVAPGSSESSIRPDPMPIARWIDAIGTS